jgi:hypothetical protein
MAILGGNNGQGAIHYSVARCVVGGGFSPPSPHGSGAGIIAAAREPDLVRSALFPLRHSLAAACVLACALLSGCEIFKKNEETTLIVGNRALGMPVGEFFDRYGRPEQRQELPDGGLQFIWVSSVMQTQGAADVDNQVCSMRVTANKVGRITAVQVMYDGQGKTRLSRCAEIFSAP